jgi:hypothetical protein
LVEEGADQFESMLETLLVREFILLLSGFLEIYSTLVDAWTSSILVTELLVGVKGFIVETRFPLGSQEGGGPPPLRAQWVLGWQSLALPGPLGKVRFPHVELSLLLDTSIACILLLQAAVVRD